MALNPFTSPLIADVGISMGDEGKGRLVYEVIEELKTTTGSPDAVGMVLKVNGGANSGHTAGGLKLNLLPAGVIDQSVQYLGIGAGVVADPRKFLWEGRPLEAAGYCVFSRLVIDERCLVSDVTHRLLDLAWEHYRSAILGEAPRGSTGRGITPSYQDEVGQWQIYYGDFLGDRELYRTKLRGRIDRAVKLIEHVCRVTPEVWNGFFDTLTHAETRANQSAIDSGVLPAGEFDFHRFKGDAPFTLNASAIEDAYWTAGQSLTAHVVDLRDRVLALLDEGRHIVGEFGQSYWLDKRHGFPPNVTASHTFTPEFFQSAGIPVQPVHTLGCCKAYDTKVGTHVFLTQMDEAHPLTVRLKQMEFGTSTGRQRMVGWFDAVEKGDCLRYGGFDDLVINKLDALSAGPDWPEGLLKICTGYQTAGGEPLYRVPRNDHVRRTLTPVYRELPVWAEDISGVRSFADLPLDAQRYVAFAVKAVLHVANRGQADGARSCNLRYIGVGPNPNQIIKDVPATPELLALVDDLVC
jgi:adenylosuccinate synthase